MFRRNLFKHFLPVALSVAMTVQSVPVTSYAAETQTVETETAVAEESEEASDEQVGNDGEEAKPEETKGEEENKTSEEVKTEETKTEETNKTSEEVKTEETKTEETKSEEEKIEAQAEEEIENNKAEELPKSEIVFDESKLEDVGGYHYSDGSYKGEYQPKVDTAKSNADDIVKAVKKATYAVIYSDADENDERYDLPFQYQWQKKGAEDKWEDIVYPQDAGEYRIKVSLAEQANLCEAAADAFVNFTIEKAKFTITSNAYTVESGITVAEVKTKIADNYEIGNDISKAAAVKECKVEIKTATGTETLADDVTIEKNESYVVVYTFTLTDDFAKNYELSDPADYTFNISQTVKFATITVEYNKQGEAVGKKYDGKAIDIKNDIVPAIKTLKVTVPNSDRDDNGLVLIEGTDNIDKLNPTWGTKAEGEFVALDSAPTDAGDYYLRLEYKNENGTYGSATEYIRVVITPVDIAIVPEVSQTEWNDGDKVSDIIKKVTYKVYDVADGKRAESARTDIDEYFWGDAYGVELDKYYNDAGDEFTVGVGEQYFKPLFVVERGVTKDGVTTWTALNPKDTINVTDLVAADASVKYRVAYSGKLCVYDTNTKGEPIIMATNADVNNVQGNYKVDLTEAAKDADAKALTIKESAAVKIDVSALLGENKAGESYDNAIISTYTGKSIFSSKSDYKKAAIVGADEKPISSDAEKDFTYTWQYAFINNADDKEDGSDIGWNYYDVENEPAPWWVYNYRLEITYTDKTNANRAKEKAYVYYTILPQDAIAVIKGAPEAYVDGKTTIGDYINSLTSETDFTLYSYNKDTKAKGDEIKLDVEDKAQLRNNFTVKMKANDGEKAGKYVECNPSDQFIPGREYVLDMNADYWNYNFGYDLDKHGKQKSYDTIWDNETCPITVKASKGIEVKIDVDYTKITDKSKNYDGKNFDLTEIKKAVRFVNAKTGEDLTEALKDKVKYYFVFKNDGNGNCAPLKTYDKYVDGNDAYLVSKNEIVAEDAPVIHGGTYALVWSLEADENYAAVEPVNADDGTYNYSSRITDITINKRELTITPVLNGDIKAGTHTNNIVTKTGSNNDTDQYQLSNPIVSGFVDDKEAENAFSKFTVSVHEDTKPDNDYAGILKSDTKYYLVENAEMKAGLSDTGYYTVTEPTYYERDYSPVSERIAFTPVRAEASVASATIDEDGHLVKAIDTISGSAQDGYIHTITARTAIPYDSTGVTIGGKLVKGNNYTIQITAPKEFDNIDSVVYETAIAKAGGIATRNGLVITATFNANNTQTAEFDIVWKPGYKETFKLDFTKAQLVNDFTKAVAPKSLAFNNVNKKMAVGETQQLDVKITKKQMSDIILLGYSVDNGDVLQVSDSGYVTALSKGTATVSVFPCFKDANDGNKVKQIEGTKAVTVKITVADVATPKISKITAFGSKAEVKYAEVANGYRREIYVLEGKNLKATEFESKIADAIKGNGDYSAFDYVKLGAEEVTDKKVTTIKVSGLQPNKEYTVYVRNVAALRELKNGAKVATSYAGAVKGFKTTAAENNGLRVYFDLNGKKNKVYCGETEEKCTALQHDLFHKFTVKLTDKKATVSVDATYLQGLSYSDKDDFIWRTLPLSKDDQKSYLNPKLEYYVRSQDYDINVLL
ncbi:MAG: Ig-like domain-containing protein, partial [Lachnospiraceae bacterium]|nr:Ig-like domain-containing protein [Lachnospiraceae bacterium]